MIDVEDVNLAAFVVDAIPDTVLTASGAPHAFERRAQLRADTMRFPT